MAGEIDVTVRADDITEPEVVAWMTDFQRRTLAAGGFEQGETCRQPERPPELCPALSLPDILRTVEPARRAPGRRSARLGAAYFSQGVVTRDRKTANLAFGVRLAVARGAEEGDRLDRGPARPARRRDRHRGRPAGAGRGRQRQPVVAAAARAHAPGGPRWRCSSCCWPFRRSRARGRGAADPDRPRHGLVRGRAVPAGPAARAAVGQAQPDVGHARRAGDRHLHRVQRAALGALPPGARGRRAPGPRDRAHLHAPPGRRCWPRASPPSPASPC